MVRLHSGDGFCFYLANIQCICIYFPRQLCVFRCIVEFSVFELSFLVIHGGSVAGQRLTHDGSTQNKLMPREPGTGQLL